MKPNQLFRTAVAGVLWLSVGASCHRSSDPAPYVVDPNDPTSRSCNDNTCCGQDNGQYDYVEYVQNVPVALLGPPGDWGFALKDSLPSLNALKSYQNKKRATLVMACDLSVSKIQNLKTSTYSSSGTIPYNYKLSGKVFQLPLKYTLTATPVLAIYVDKIEAIN